MTKNEDGEYILVTRGVDFTESDNPTVKLIGEAIETETEINVMITNGLRKAGGAITETTKFDTFNRLTIGLNPEMIDQALVPGNFLDEDGSRYGLAVRVTTPTALVHELGHAYGNFINKGQSGRFGNTKPWALKFENKHRRRMSKPTERTALCAFAPVNNCS